MGVKVGEGAGSCEAVLRMYVGVLGGGFLMRTRFCFLKRNIPFWFVCGRVEGRGTESVDLNRKSRNLHNIQRNNVSKGRGQIPILGRFHGIHKGLHSALYTTFWCPVRYMLSRLGIEGVVGLLRWF